MMAALAGSASGQYAVGVSAVVVEDVAMPPLEVGWQAAGSGALVIRAPAPGRGGLTRVVEQVWLARESAEPRVDGAAGFWRRADGGLEWSAGAGASVLELIEMVKDGVVQLQGGDETGALVILRIIASNT